MGATASSAHILAAQILADNVLSVVLLLEMYVLLLG